MKFTKKDIEEQSQKFNIIINFLNWIWENHRELFSRYLEIQKKLDKEFDKMFKEEIKFLDKKLVE